MVIEELIMDFFVFFVTFCYTILEVQQSAVHYLKIKVVDRLFAIAMLIL